LLQVSFGLLFTTAHWTLIGAAIQDALPTVAGCDGFAQNVNILGGIDAFIGRKHPAGPRFRPIAYSPFF